MALQFKGSFSGWEFAVWRICIAALTLISVLFFMTKLKKSTSTHLTIYPHFIQITSLTFVFVLIAYLIPVPEDNSILLVYRILYATTIIVQWWIQIAVVIFMFQEDPEKASVKRTIIFTSIFTIILALSMYFFFFFFLFFGLVERGRK